MYTNKPQALGSLIEDFIENFPHRKALKKGMALSLWSGIVGERIASQTENMHFKGDKLFMVIKNPGWRFEVHAQRFKIMEQLNRKLKEEIVKEIVIKA